MSQGTGNSQAEIVKAVIRIVEERHKQTMGDLHEMLKVVVASESSQVVSLDSIKAFLPEDLQQMLLFEEDDYHFFIRPKEYLGSEIFVRVGNIVRDKLGGEYVSAGKDSCFRVSKKPGSEPAAETQQLNQEDLLKHGGWKGRRISQGQYGIGSLSWGWDFKRHFKPETIMVLEKGPLTVEGYVFKLLENIVQVSKKE